MGIRSNGQYCDIISRTGLHRKVIIGGRDGSHGLCDNRWYFGILCVCFEFKYLVGTQLPQKMKCPPSHWSTHWQIHRRTDNLSTHWRLASSSTDRQLVNSLANSSTDRQLVNSLANSSTDRQLVNSLANSSTDRQLV
jgi:hypothetical protein